MAETKKVERTIEQWNIFQKVWGVASEVGKVKQSLNVATKVDKNGRVVSSYKAVSINDVVDSLIPALEKYRIAIIPKTQEIIRDEELTTTTQYGERKQFWIRMRCEFEAVNIDNPEERIIAEGYGDGFDSGDKSFGKAMTYARKVALINLFNLSRGEDPDVEASKEYKPKKTEQKELTQAKPKYPSESEALPTELIMQIQEVRRQIEGYGVDTRDPKFAEFMSGTMGVEVLDPAMMTMAQGVKALNALRSFSKKIAEKRAKDEEQPF